MDQATQDRVARVHKQMLAEFDGQPVCGEVVDKMQARAQQLGAKEGVTISGILVGADDLTQISYNIILPGNTP